MSTGERPPVTRRPLRIGVQLPEVERVAGWPEHAAMARAAEAAGFDSIWLGDHLLYRGDGREERGPWDAWTMLAALATVTDRVRLGPLVACTAFAPPGLLARRAAALQEISGGRFVLALGAGWNEAEFLAFGLPFDHRASRFVESFEVIRRLLDGEHVTYDGTYTRAADAVLLPVPARRPELMVGSTGERVLRAALPHVDAWNVWFDWFGNTPDGFAEQDRRMASIARDVGRDPSQISRSATVSVALDDQGPGSRPHAAGVPALRGTTEQIAARLREFHDAGLDEAILVVDPITEDAIRHLAPAVQLCQAG